MKINKPSGFLSGLLGKYSSEIIIQSDGVEKLLASLDLLNDLVLNDEPEVKNGLVYIYPKSIFKSYNYVMEDKEYAKMINREVHSKEIRIKDFADSSNFYELFKGKKSQHKIVSDEFSANRAALIYEYATKIETELRKEFIIKFGNGVHNPKNYRKELPDHKISQFDAREFFGELLLSDSSDKYFLSELSDSSTSDEFLKVRNSKKIDELQIPISEAEFNMFVETRNLIMHFKVITPESTLEFLDFVSTFEINQKKKEFNEIVQLIDSKNRKLND